MYMAWKILLYIFLIIAFLIFLKLSTIQINGRKMISLPIRVILALMFPLFLVLIIFFGSLLLLFILAIFLVALVFFFLGKSQIFYKKSKEPIVIHKVKR